MDKAMHAIGMEHSAAHAAVVGPQHDVREQQLLDRISELEQQLAAAR